ncbi:MAG: hypothetical protein ACI9QL_004691, partial [Candidatus Omnitrophota bacterium]
WVNMHNTEIGIMTAHKHQGLLQKGQGAGRQIDREEDPLYTDAGPPDFAFFRLGGGFHVSVFCKRSN